MQHDSYEQLTTEPSTTEFFSYLGDIFEEDKAPKTSDTKADVYLQYYVSIDENLSIKSRSIYSIMQFLGDIGGF